jgi:hypothetical protein
MSGSSVIILGVHQAENNVHYGRTHRAPTLRPAGTTRHHQIVGAGGWSGPGAAICGACVVMKDLSGSPGGWPNEC